jgi:heat shock protein HtpX
MDRVSFFDEIESNKRKSIALTLLVVLFLSILIYVISMLFDPATGMLITIFGLVIIVANLYTSYFYGDKIVLKYMNAKPAEGSKYIYLNNAVESMALAAGLPAPKVYVVESNEINAFATGRDPQHSSIAVTTGLLEKLNRQELEGVIGHEMSHVRNYDIRFMMLVAVMVGLVAILSELFLRSLRGSSDNKKAGMLIIVGIVLAIFAPIIVRLVQAAVSRKRELLADAGSVQLTRNSDELASALQKIAKNNKGNMQVSEAVSHLFFVDPVTSALDALYATHPPVNERIEKLRAM